jgi:hypothetical protein
VRKRTKRSKGWKPERKTSEESEAAISKAWIKCEKGRQSEAKQPLRNGQNRTKYRKILLINCPFELQVARKDSGCWGFKVTNQSHNHPPSTTQLAHPVLRKLDRSGNLIPFLRMLELLHYTDSTQVFHIIKMKLDHHYSAYQASFDAHLSRRDMRLNGPFWALCRGRIAQSALLRVYEEPQSMKLNKNKPPRPPCRRINWKTMGIPCGHMLKTRTQLTPDDFDQHWHLKRDGVYLDPPLSDPFLDVVTPNRPNNQLQARRRREPARSTLLAKCGFEIVEKEVYRQPRRQQKEQDRNRNQEIQEQSKRKRVDSRIEDSSLLVPTPEEIAAAALTLITTRRQREKTGDNSPVLRPSPVFRPPLVMEPSPVLEAQVRQLQASEERIAHYEQLQCDTVAAAAAMRAETASRAALPPLTDDDDLVDLLLLQIRADDPELEDALEWRSALGEFMSGQMRIRVQNRLS